MYAPVTNEPPLLDDDILPGDVLRSEYGRTVRTVVAVEDDTVVVRTPSGMVDSIALDAARRFWRKIGSAANESGMPDKTASAEPGGEAADIPDADA